MAGLPGESYADLLDTIVGWLIDPAGYAKVTREHKIKVFNDALIAAVKNRDRAAADAIYAGLRRLSDETT